jgi:hypothetical protein
MRLLMKISSSTFDFPHRGSQQFSVLRIEMKSLNKQISCFDVFLRQETVSPLPDPRSVRRKANGHHVRSEMIRQTQWTKYAALPESPCCRWSRPVPCPVALLKGATAVNMETHSFFSTRNCHRKDEPRRHIRRSLPKSAADIRSTRGECASRQTMAQLRLVSGAYVAGEAITASDWVTNRGLSILATDFAKRIGQLAAKDISCPGLPRLKTRRTVPHFNQRRQMHRCAFKSKQAITNKILNHRFQIFEMPSCDGASNLRFSSIFEGAPPPNLCSSSRRNSWNDGRGPA